MDHKLDELSRAFICNELKQDTKKYYQEQHWDTWIIGPIVSYLNQLYYNNISFTKHPDKQENTRNDYTEPNKKCFFLFKGNEYPGYPLGCYSINELKTFKIYELMSNEELETMFEFLSVMPKSEYLIIGSNRNNYYVIERG